jgi:hypothetical protein
MQQVILSLPSLPFSFHFFEFYLFSYLSLPFLGSNYKRYLNRFWDCFLNLFHSPLFLLFNVLLKFQKSQTTPKGWFEIIKKLKSDYNPDTMGLQQQTKYTHTYKLVTFIHTPLLTKSTAWWAGNKPARTRHLGEQGTNLLTQENLVRR